MEIIPIITTILIYSTGILVVIVLISSITKRIFIVTPKERKISEVKNKPMNKVPVIREAEKSAEELERIEYERRKRKKERQRRLAEEEQKGRRYSESSSKQKDNREAKKRNPSSRFVIVNDILKDEEIKSYNKSAFYPLKTGQAKQFNSNNDFRHTH